MDLEHLADFPDAVQFSRLVGLRLGRLPHPLQRVMEVLISSETTSPQSLASQLSRQWFPALAFLAFGFVEDAGLGAVRVRLGPGAPEGIADRFDLRSLYIQ